VPKSRLRDVGNILVAIEHARNAGRHF
jgi:hypothetical protein